MLFQEVEDLLQLWVVVLPSPVLPFAFAKLFSENHSERVWVDVEFSTEIFENLHVRLLCLLGEVQNMRQDFKIVN